jgi:nitrogen fixation-related uncharacterized protein
MNKQRLFKIAAVLFFLLPAALGFSNKLKELFLLQGDEQGSFALMPIVNYLLTSLGFFFLLLWAATQGMFHDIEKPKHAMLRNEEFLDELEQEDARKVGGD